MSVASSIVLFILAGLCEIGGGNLVWLWLRDYRSVVLGMGHGHRPDAPDRLGGAICLAGVAVIIMYWPRPGA